MLKRWSFFINELLQSVIGKVHTVTYKLFRILKASTGNTLDERKVWCWLHNTGWPKAAASNKKDT